MLADSIAVAFCLIWNWGQKHSGQWHCHATKYGAQEIKGAWLAYRLIFISHCFPLIIADGAHVSMRHCSRRWPITCLIWAKCRPRNQQHRTSIITPTGIIAGASASITTPRFGHGPLNQRRYAESLLGFYWSGRYSLGLTAWISSLKCRRRNQSHLEYYDGRRPSQKVVCKKPTTNR